MIAIDAAVLASVHGGDGEPYVDPYEKGINRTQDSPFYAKPPEHYFEPRDPRFKTKEEIDKSWDQMWDKYMGPWENFNNIFGGARGPRLRGPR